MPRPKPFIEEEAGKLITAENNNQKQIRTIEGILFHKHGGGITDEFPDHDDFENYDDYLAAIAKVGPKVSGDGIEDMTITMEKLHQGLQDTIKAGAVEKDEIKSKMIDDADGITGQDTEDGSGIKTPHIQDEAVTTGKIADDAVATGKIANDAVTMDKLHENVKDAISAGAVEEDEIESKMIADADETASQDTTQGLGIKTPHIQNNAVTEEKIADEAVTMNKLQADVKDAISAGEVGKGEIKSKMIDSADGTTGQNTEDGSGIKTPHIQDEAVTMNKLDEGVKTAISAGVVGDDEIESKMIADADETASQDTTQGLGIKTPHIQNNAVTEEKIADEAVTMDKLDTDVKDAMKLADGKTDTDRRRFVPLLAYTLGYPFVDGRNKTVKVGNAPDGVAFDGSHIWVSNLGANSVSKIDIEANKVIAEVRVERPYGVAFDGSHIWVSNYAINSVSKIDIEANKVIAKVGVGSSPRGVAFDGSHIWVCNSAENSVSKIDIKANRVIAKVEVERPYEVAFDGSHIWVSNSGANSVSKIDIEANKVIAKVEVESPYGVAFDGSHIWVSNYATNSVSKTDIEANKVIAEVGVGSGPRGVAFDGSHIWVSNVGANSVSKIDIEANKVITEVGVGGSPRGIAFDGSHIWVCNSANNVSKILV